MKHLWMLAAAGGLIALAACRDDLTSVADVATLQIIDVTVGTGATAAVGKRLTVHYTGWLYDENTADHHGKKFDSSRDRGTPYQFTPGVDAVIQGWQQGVPGMKVGGRRTLIIPSRLGYGSAGSGSIPGGSALVFDIELLGVQ